uniref:Uncharacterized protein n=1 Tax=uncultured Bacillota bacterium TaxID=344338 RepID=A0A650EPH5_9FIRM|nr:hypothetical protein Firmicute1046_2140 [uncultured Firmicutes bacterium]
MRILEEFWYGNLHPNEKLFRRQTEFDHILKLLVRNEDKLMESLNDSEKETFTKYRECCDEISQISECEIFINGFQLGARFIIECYNNHDGVFEDVT